MNLRDIEDYIEDLDVTNDKVSDCGSYVYTYRLTSLFGVVNQLLQYAKTKEEALIRERELNDKLINKVINVDTNTL